MGELLLTILDDEKYLQYKLADVVANSFNGVVNNEYSFFGINYHLPIINDDGIYYLDCQHEDKWEYYHQGNRIANRLSLKHGDFVEFRNNEHLLKALITDSSYLDFSSNMYELSRNSAIEIGRAEDANIVIDINDYISRKQARIVTDGEGRSEIINLSQTNCVYVNGKAISSKQLVTGDHIFIMGSTIVYFDTYLLMPVNLKVNNLTYKAEIGSVSPVTDYDKKEFFRTPRITKSLDEQKIELDTPPAPQNVRETPFILTAGPSLTMMIGMMVSLYFTVTNALKGGNVSTVAGSATMAVSMLLGALLWPSLNRKYNRKQAAEKERIRRERYSKYLSDKEQEIARSYKRNFEVWNESLYPSSDKLINNVVEQNRNLWERSYRDDDFLEVRLGTGNKDFEVEIATKKKGFELEDDMLKEKSYQIADNYGILKDVPITLSLKQHNIVGIFGEYENLIKSLITNIVSLYSPDELNLVLIYNHYQEELLRKFNDLPHTWSSDYTSRYVATSESEARTLFEKIDDEVQAREESLGRDDPRIPHYIVMCFDQSIIEDIPFKKTLLNKDNELGFSSLFISESFSQLPKECETLVQLTEDKGILYIKNENDNKTIDFRLERISDSQIDKLVTGLSRIKIKKEKTVTSIPESISFLDVFQVGNVDALNIETHWNTNQSHKSLAAPIGVKAGGEVFYLDIHEKYHGCHGLVAGTTGSGKSEFLQAYILSMMINYSPNEVGFVLVDFKGGDMARPFLKSPHLAATISNLSGSTLQRALLSFKAEINRRQKIFNETAASLKIDKIDINSYHKYYKENKVKEPLPHLIIVIDEFAQLKSQQPEFMDELISIAQVGRSLGIHLILATQKPSGVVDPQIWSNSRFKVCLKVNDKQDSNDMIGKPVAASIKNPGRAYVQVGYDEIFELIQSGYSGADYVAQDKFVAEESVTVSMVNWPLETLREVKDLPKSNASNSSQIEAIVNSIAKLADETNTRIKPLWLEPLPEELKLENLPANIQLGYGQVITGLMDIPQEQKQLGYVVDFIKDGHIAIYGESGIGKSAFIMTTAYALANRYSPDEFNMIVIDFDGGSLQLLNSMPHCGRYVRGDDYDGVNDTMDLIESLIEERQNRFTESVCSDYEAYLATGKKDMPLVVVAIDNYMMFRQNNANAESQLIELFPRAKSCGIYFMITGNSRNAIFYKLTDHISNRIVMHMVNKDDYRDILNTQVSIVPEQIKGRGLVLLDRTPVEVQIAVPFETKMVAERNRMIKEAFEHMKNNYGKKVQYNVPEKQTEEVSRHAARSSRNQETDVYSKQHTYDTYRKKAASTLGMQNSMNDLVIGKDLDSGNNVGINKNSQDNIFVGNPYHDIKLLNKFVSEYERENIEVFVYTRHPETVSMSQYCISDINSFVKEKENAILSNSILIIDGLRDLYEDISNEMLPVLNKIIKNHKFKKIITIDPLDRIKEIYDTELCRMLIKSKYGIIIGGNADNKLAYMLNEVFYSVAEEYRGRKLNENEACVYCEDAVAFVSLGG